MSLPERNAEIDTQHLARSMRLLRALDHDLRRQIIHLLDRNERLNVTEIVIALRIEQATASQHLAILRKLSFVKNERQGKRVYYSLDRDRLSTVLDLISRLGA